MSHLGAVKEVTTRILMCRPTHFTVAYEINPWMNLQQNPAVIRTHAQKQWDSLCNQLKRHGAQLELLDGAPGLPDMPFTANAGLLIGPKRAYLSRFKYKERQGEQQHFEQWFRQNQYEVLLAEEPFEGAGDALFVGDTLVAGYGHRTSITAYNFVKDYVKKIVFCQLVDPRFYHLDTCFCPLDDHSAMWFPPAFSTDSQKHIKDSIPRLLEVSEQDAQRFACNSVVVGNKVIIPSGCVETMNKLSEFGFIAHEVDMGEFMKAGGAAKCLTLTLNS